MELRPCPFCGGEAAVIDHGDGRVSVGCARDYCLGFSGLGWTYETEGDAAAAWNTRAVEQPILDAIDRLRRELSGYHGQLKAHKDLAAHADNQRRRIGELEALYAGVKAENAKLRELVRDMWALSCMDDASIFEQDEVYERMVELGVDDGRA